jgi:hypothetical protein
MYTVKGIISGSVETKWVASLMVLLNLGLGALGVMIVGFLLHIGWNWL